jgi:hypothetical protein
MPDKKKTYVRGIGMDSFHDIKALQAAAAPSARQPRVPLAKPSGAQGTAQPVHPVAKGTISMLAKRK